MEIAGLKFFFFNLYRITNFTFSCSAIVTVIQSYIYSIHIVACVTSQQNSNVILLSVICYCFADLVGKLLYIVLES